MLDPKAISDTYLVDGLTPAQLSSIAEICMERSLEPGELLCRQGEVGTELFVVLDGEFGIQIGDGERLATVGANAVVGEMVLVDKRRRSASVVAIAPSRVAAIASDDLHEQMVTDGDLGFLVFCNIARVLSERLREADAKLDGLMSASIKG